jgi:hypothetical protein
MILRLDYVLILYVFEDGESSTDYLLLTRQHCIQEYATNECYGIPPKLVTTPEWTKLEQPKRQ